MTTVYRQQHGETITAMRENKPEATRHSLQPDLRNIMYLHLDLTGSHKLPSLKSYDITCNMLSLPTTQQG